MKIKPLKILILLAVSLILGTVISFKDISFSHFLYNTYGFEEAKLFITDTIIYIAYSFILIFSLLWFNLEWNGKDHKIRLFVLSLLITMCAVLDMTNNFTEQIYFGL